MYPPVSEICTEFASDEIKARIKEACRDRMRLEG